MVLRPVYKHVPNTRYVSSGGYQKPHQQLWDVPRVYMIYKLHREMLRVPIAQCISTLGCNVSFGWGFLCK